MLKRILELLKERTLMSLRELELCLDVDASGVEGMLNTLKKKGRIKELEGRQCQSSCHAGHSGCKGCATKLDESYYRYFVIVEEDDKETKNQKPDLELENCTS